MAAPKQAGYPQRPQEPKQSRPITRHTPDYDIVSAVHHTLGEGPVWDYRSHRLVWVDAYSEGFYSSDGSGAPTHHRTGRFTIGIALWGEKPGRYLVTTDRGLFEWRNDSLSPVIPDAIGAVGLSAHIYRFNDVGVAPDGAFLAGVMEWEPTEQMGRLLAFPPSALRVRRGRGSGRLPAGGSDSDKGETTALPTTLLDHVALPNGMGFSPDTRSFYFTDSLRKQILRFPYSAAGARSDLGAAAAFGTPEVLVDSPDREGVPDGMTVAADGTIFSARWGGGVVDRYDEHGRLIEQFVVPMEQPSSVCFGGADLATLFVTSATEGMDAATLAASPSHRNGFTIALDVHAHGRRAVVLPGE